MPLAGLEPATLTPTSQTLTQLTKMVTENATSSTESKIDIGGDAEAGNF